MLLVLIAYTDSDVIEDMLDIDIVSNFISAIAELLKDDSCIVLSMWTDFEEKLSCMLLTAALSLLSSISAPPCIWEDTVSKKNNKKVIIAVLKSDKQI